MEGIRDLIFTQGEDTLTSLPYSGSFQLAKTSGTSVSEWNCMGKKEKT